MKTDKLNLHFGVVAILILVAAMSRLVVHLPNFTPITGMALFAAAHFSKKYWAFVIPMAALFLSNLILNNVLYAEYYEGFVLFGSASIFWVFLAFAAIIGLGLYFLQKISIARLVGVTFAASLVFFVVTNLAVWWFGPPFYPKTWVGLVECFTLAIPFYRNMILGDFFYVTALFGSYELIRRFAPQWNLQAQIQHG